MSTILQDLKLFDTFARKLGNRYVASLCIAKLSRQYSNQLPGPVIESKLAHWVLTGQDPNKLRIRPRRDPDIDFMEDLLCFIDDKAVCDEVRYCYKASIRNRHLIYSCNTNLSKYQQDRVSILLRMCWYSSREGD